MTDMNPSTRWRPTLTLALLLAAGIFAVLLVQYIVEAVAAAVVWASSPESFIRMFEGFPLWLATLGLPFAIGVFVTFWLVLPIAASHGWPQIVVRAVAAAAIGAAGVLLASLVLAVFSGFGLGGSIFGASFPLSYSTSNLESGLRSGAHGAIFTLVNTIPLVVLAAFAGQYWMRRQPTSRSDAAMIDEV